MFITLCVCSAALSCPPLSDPTDCSLTSFSVHGIISAGIFEWIAISRAPGNLLDPRDQTCISFGSCIGRWILYHWFTWEAHFNIYCSPYVRLSNLWVVCYQPLQNTLTDVSFNLPMKKQRLTTQLSCPRSQRRLMASDRVLASVHHQSLGS